MAVIPIGPGGGRLASQRGMCLKMDPGDGKLFLHWPSMNAVEDILPNPPHGERWALEFDDDDNLAVLESPSECHWASTFFPNDLYVGAGGSLFVVDKHSGCRKWLSQHLHSHREF